MPSGKKATHNFNSDLTLTVLNESDRTFEGWITVDVVDRHSDRVDPLGFTAEEYMTIIGGIIMGTHTNLPIGRWNKIEIREKEPGKLAWYGWGKIFKGISSRSLEDYPVWRDYWQYMVECYRNGRPVGLSIGGDPDYESAPPYTECEKGQCWRTIPKAWWYETSVVMNRKGPSVPANLESYVEKVNTLAKAFGADPGTYGELIKAHIHVDRNPSEAQKKAGNYKKGHIRLHGLDITIENPKGSIRSGTDRNGKKWSTKMAADYGYIKRTEGVDGDHLDVFVGPDHEDEWVLVLWQLDEKGNFDEHKVLMGFSKHEEALDTYGACYDDPEWVEKRVGQVREFRMSEFKEWMKEEGLKKDFSKPVPRDAKSVYPRRESPVRLADTPQEHGDKGFTEHFPRTPSGKPSQYHTPVEMAVPSGIKKKAPSITEAPNDQGKVGRLAGDVGHIHPPSGMDREDPVDDDRRYTQQRTLPESNVKRLGEAFPSLRGRRHGGMSGRGSRGIRHSTGHVDPTKPPKYASWEAEHPSGITILIYEGTSLDGDAIYESLNDIPAPELEKIAYLEVYDDYIRVEPKYGTVQKHNSHVQAETLEGLVVASLLKRYGDYSPTNKEIEGHTGLVLHGQRDYPEEEGDNFVGSKDGLGVSPVRKDEDMDEDVLTSALRKALTSPALRKDHGKGYSADPEEELSGRERDADSTSGNVPMPLTEKPKWRPGTKVQPNAHRPVSDTVAEHKHPEMAKSVPGLGGSSVDHSSSPEPIRNNLQKDGCGCGGLQKGGAAGMAEKPGHIDTSPTNEPSQPIEPGLNKSSDEDKGKKHEKDDENTRGRMGPQDGKSRAAGDGGAPEDGEEKPQEGFQNGNMPPQAMDASGPPNDPSGLQTHPTQMAPGQPDAQTNMPLPGAAPMVGDSLGAMLLSEMTPEELDAIALAVLSLKKDGAAGGSPLTTDTPGAHQARMGPKPISTKV